MKKPTSENLVSRITTAVMGVISNPKPRWLTVQNQASDVAEMVIDGPIGKSWYDPTGTSAAEFRKALNAIPKGKKVLVRINSEGGAVGDALTIYNLLQERGEDVTTKIDGYALSSASIIALAGYRVDCPKSAILMIHEPWSMTVGDEADHEKAAKMLKTHGETIAQIYAARTGKSIDEMRDLMKAESWFSGSEAIAAGLADPSEDDGDEDEDETQASFNAFGAHWEPNANGIYNKATGEIYHNVPEHVLARVASGERLFEAVASLRRISTTAPGGGVVDTAVNSPQTKNTMKETTTPPTTPVAAAPNPPANPNPPVTPQNVVSASEMAELRTALNNERKARIEARVDSLIVECRLDNSERADAVTRAMADESYLTVIAKRPQFNVGGSPLGHGVNIEVIGNTFDKIKAERSARVRNELRKNEWNGILNHAMSMDQRGQRFQPYGTLTSTLPVNANSYTSALIVDFLADQAITALVATLPALRVFTRDFMASGFAPLSTLQVRLVTAPDNDNRLQRGTKSAGISNYETGDSKVTAVAVPMTEFSEAVNVNSTELMSGLRIEYLANHALQTLGVNLVQTALQVFNASTFTGGAVANGTIQAHYGTFAWNVAGGVDMATLRAAIGKSPTKNAILDPVLFSKLINIPIQSGIAPAAVGDLTAGQTNMRNVFGWDEIAETSAWASPQGLPGTTNSTIGIGLNPQACVVAARLPITPPEGIPGNTLLQTNVTIPGLDLTIAVFQWFSLASRSLWASYGVVFGAAAGDLTAACHLKSLGL